MQYFVYVIVVLCEARKTFRQVRKGEEDNSIELDEMKKCSIIFCEGFRGDKLM